ncbi:uncharacterized protein C1orf131 homolog isoform X1 [Cygnus atratus]|uniref:uncharacterized protein C1orf131 homolog isoform X1 n=1 Tax=Cygnus atratus TaxID=8868 RepID=UPI0015D61CEF|nr:uncharacterized protein C1orf131 homolog isoform X1 [Cygnus atratus]
MGAREPCRRLEAVLGALYDLGEEPGNGGEEEAAEEESQEPVAAGGGGGGGGREAGGQRGARGFFVGLRDELRAAGPPPPPAPPLQPVEVVVFRGRKRRVKVKEEEEKGRPGPGSGAQTKAVAEKKNKQEFNFEKARLEVHRFGITGYEKQEQRLWERERAIMLGAKPPKKEHINYKTYQEKMKEKKAGKEDDKGKTQEHKGDSLKKKKKDLKERKAKRKKSVPSIWPAGQVGKFRDGTLILQSGDIKKIKSSKVIK